MGTSKKLSAAGMVLLGTFSCIKNSNSRVSSSESSLETLNNTSQSALTVSTSSGSGSSLALTANSVSADAYYTDDFGKVQVKHLADATISNGTATIKDAPEGSVVLISDNSASTSSQAVINVPPSNGSTSVAQVVVNSDSSAGVAVFKQGLTSPDAATLIKSGSLDTSAMVAMGQTLAAAGVAATDSNAQAMITTMMSTQKSANDAMQTAGMDPKKHMETVAAKALDPTTVADAVKKGSFSWSTTVVAAAQDAAKTDMSANKVSSDKISTFADPANAAITAVGDPSTEKDATKKAFQKNLLMGKAYADAVNKFVVAHGADMTSTSLTAMKALIKTDIASAGEASLLKIAAGTSQLSSLSTLMTDAETAKKAGTSLDSFATSQLSALQSTNPTAYSTLTQNMKAIASTVTQAAGAPTMSADQKAAAKAQCGFMGGTWNETAAMPCDMSKAVATSTPSSDAQKLACTSMGGTWAGTTCTPPAALKTIISNAQTAVITGGAVVAAPATTTTASSGTAAATPTPVAPTTQQTVPTCSVMATMPAMGLQTYVTQLRQMRTNGATVHFCQVAPTSGCTALGTSAQAILAAAAVTNVQVALQANATFCDLR